MVGQKKEEKCIRTWGNYT